MYTVDEDNSVATSLDTLLANDSDGEGEISLVDIGSAEHGELTVNEDGTVIFTPEADYFGEAGFSYTVSDTAGNQSEGKVLVNVTNVNDVPVVADDCFIIAEDTPLALAA